MDLPCFEWQKHAEKKWDGLSAAEKTSFSSLLEVDDILSFAQSQTDRDVTVLSDISKKYQMRKDSESASGLREKGNAYFRARDYTTATMFYSQGVCCAPPGSEELALCYANRSASRLRLHLHQECLQDIGRALKHGYPTHLQQKLLDRRQQCLKHQRDDGSSKEGGSGIASECDGSGSLPHVSPAVHFRFSPEKGRHLVAREDVAAGEILLEERAFACVLIPGTGKKSGVQNSAVEEENQDAFGTEHLLCHHCLSRTNNPVPCPGCSYTRYCGEGCQQVAWQRHHCWECPFGGELRSLGVLTHLALRVVFRTGLKEVQKVREMASWTSAPPSGQETSPRTCQDPPQHQLDGSYMCIYCLLPHVSGHPSSLRFLCAVTVATLCRSLKEAGVLQKFLSDECDEQGGGAWCMLGAVVLRHMFQLRCNSQAVTVLRDCGVGCSSVSAMQEVRVATAIFPTLSMLNHSCHPNIGIAFRTVGVPVPPRGQPGTVCGGVMVTARAFRDVGSGQELLHCYGPHYSRMPTSERRRLLLEQYFFHCGCDACRDHQGATAASGLRCARCGCPLQCAKLGYLCPRSGCDFQLAHGELSRRLQGLEELLDQATRLIEMDRPDQAAQELQVAIRDASRFLEETHPLQGQLADVAARAQAAMGNWRQAATQLSRSIPAIQVQYGDDSAELGRQLFKLVQLHFNGSPRRLSLSSPKPVMSSPCTVTLCVRSCRSSGPWRTACRGHCDIYTCNHLIPSSFKSFVMLMAVAVLGINFTQGTMGLNPIRVSGSDAK
nr:SET and MYND domain-containing protein 4 isoform X2 [Paramormyrops kingsleyae]